MSDAECSKAMFMLLFVYLIRVIFCLKTCDCSNVSCNIRSTEVSNFLTF